MSDAMMARTASGTGTSQTIDTLHVRTDSTGTASFRYVASQFGGVERIRARLLSDTTKWDTLSVKTRVPGLDSLPIGPNYVKVGGRCEHHGPGGGGSCETPDNNHWGTNRLTEAIAAIADSFAVYYPGFRIRVNDMSLPLGGGFDVGANWEADIVDQYPNDGRCNDTGHCEHREGTVADISFSVVNPSGQVVAMTSQQRNRINAIIRHVVGAPLEHGHYHIGQE